MSGLDTLLGAGQPTACKVISKDLAIHWYPTMDDGAPCFCGASTRTPDAEGDDVLDLDWEAPE